jgi:pyruvate,water dikinase
VLSLDWHEPTAGELGAAITASDDRAVVRERHAALAVRRRDAERACLAALADHPVRRRRFIRMLRATQHYAALREEQAREMTLAWPVLRAAVRRLGQHVHDRGLAADAEDVFFLTRDEVAAALVADSPAPLAGVAARRAEVWRRQRRLAAPLTLGVAAGVVGNPMARIADAARDSRDLPDGAVVGHPASAGRATGPVRRVDGPADFAAVTAGDVLVASTTAPAFTPLFALAAAVVTDGGTLAAHASLIAREYGIPAVVGTGDATRRLRPGQLVLVDGGAGTVTPL